MMDTKQEFLVRKDIARMLSVSERTVRRYEVEWRLHETRIRITRRMVRYHRERALIALRTLGFF
jgi:predicted transcriptional regulator